MELLRTDRQGPGAAGRRDRRPAGDLDGPQAGRGAARLGRPALRRVPARGSGRSVGDRPLSTGGRDGAAALLRRHAGGLGDARAGLDLAPDLDRRSLGAAALRHLLGRHDTEPLEPADDAGLPRGIPHRSGPGPAQPTGGGRTAPLSAADAARQQADPGRPLDPGQRRAAGHRGPQRGAGRHRQRLARAQAPPPKRAASRSTRSPAPSSSRRSSMSATIPATRSPNLASGACTRAATTRCMATAEKRRDGRVARAVGRRAPLDLGGARPRAGGRAGPCVCGGSPRACPTPTTPTRATISCPTPSKCSSTGT